MAIVVTALGVAQGKDVGIVTLSGLSWNTGDVLFAVIACDSSLSLTGVEWAEDGATWKDFDANDVSANNAGNVLCYIFRATTTADASATGVVRINYGSQAYTMAVYKATGLATSPLDKTKTAVNTSTTPSSTDTTTTTQADELLIGGIGTEGPDGDLPGTWNGDTVDNNQRLGTTGAAAASNITVAAATKIVAVTGTYSADKTGIDSRDWAAAIATYKAVEAAALARSHGYIIG